MQEKKTFIVKVRQKRRREHGVSAQAQNVVSADFNQVTIAWFP
jgi:hypothetical protein